MAVVEIARYPDVARIADDPYRAKRPGSKVATDQRVAKQHDVGGRVDLLDPSEMHRDRQAEACRDGTHDLLEQDRARLVVGEHEDLRAQSYLLELSFVRTLTERHPER